MLGARLADERRHPLRVPRAEARERFAKLDFAGAEELLKLALELFVMTLMCSAGYFGNELCNKPYWDTQMHGIDGQVPIDIVDMAAQPEDASELGAVAPIEDMPRAMISTPENIV